MIVGQFAPDQRGRGLGARLLDFALDGAAPGHPVRVETESLTVAADVLYRSRGLRCVFAQDLMSLGQAAAPNGVACRQMPGFMRQMT